MCYENLACNEHKIFRNKIILSYLEQYHTCISQQREIRILQVTLFFKLLVICLKFTVDYPTRFATRQIKCNKRNRKLFLVLSKLTRRLIMSGFMGS